jgi:hypothetical protein
MTANRGRSPADAWASIDREKRLDRIIRTVSIVAWTVTFVLVLVFGIMVSMQVAQMIRAMQIGAVSWINVLGAAFPLMIVLGTLSLLIAVLSTVGIFLRLRTASLAEIQLRLAALEQMLASRPDAP